MLLYPSFHGFYSSLIPRRQVCLWRAYSVLSPWPLPWQPGHHGSAATQPLPLQPSIRRSDPAVPCQASRHHDKPAIITETQPLLWQPIRHRNPAVAVATQLSSQQPSCRARNWQKYKVVPWTSDCSKLLVHNFVHLSWCVSLGGRGAPFFLRC